MSAVLAGKNCKGCARQPWLVSLGHPKWYDDVVKRKKKPGVLYTLFREYQTSGLCPVCYLEFMIEDMQKRTEKYTDEFISIVLASAGVTEEMLMEVMKGE